MAIRQKIAQENVRIVAVITYRRLRIRTKEKDLEKWNFETFFVYRMKHRKNDKIDKDIEKRYKLEELKNGRI